MAPQVGNIGVDLLVHKNSALRNVTPQPQQLEYGEIAVNYFVDETQRDWPFLSIKTIDGQVRKFFFSPDEVLPGVDMRLTGGYNATNPPPPQPFEGQALINTGTGTIDPGWGVTLIGSPSLRGGELFVFNSGAWSLLTYIPPDASTTVRGIVELADDVETISGVDTVRAVTPKSLAALTATTTRRGLVELATDAEVAAGIATDLAVTVSGLEARRATTTLAGLVELATDAEAVAGTDVERAVTASGVSAALDVLEVLGTAPVSVQQAGRVFTISVALATATDVGLVAYATAAETTAGTEVAKAITPKGLADAVIDGGTY